MIRILLVIIFSSFVAQLTAQEQRARQLLNERKEVFIKFYYPSQIQNLANNMSIIKLKNDSVFAYLNENEFQNFLKLKISFEVIEPLKLQKKKLKALEVLDFTFYPTYTSYLDFLNNIQLTYADKCKLYKFGKTLHAKDLHFIRINTDTTKIKPSVFYTSSMHGNETGGYILMLRLADYLLKQYQKDELVTRLVDSLDIWINPVANPDGMYYGGNDLTFPARSNANGIDLNRNFPNPYSVDSIIIIEPENRIMIDFMKKYPFTISANFHSGTEVVNYPWDWTKTNHNDSLWFKNISLEYASLAQQYGRNGYFSNEFPTGVTDGAEWYVVQGGRQDYFTYLGGREVTIELDGYYVTPEDSLNNLWNYNYRSLLSYLNQATYGIHGVVTDSLTGKPVHGRIEVINHDDSKSCVYSNKNNGSYYRFISPGTYSLRFSANGYYSKEIENIVVHDKQTTYLNTKLLYSGILLTKEVEENIFKIYPNPPKDHIRVTGGIASSIKIYDFSGIEVIKIKNLQNKELDIRHLTQGLYFMEVIDLKGNKQYLKFLKL